MGQTPAPAPTPGRGFGGRGRGGPGRGSGNRRFTQGRRRGGGGGRGHGGQTRSPGSSKQDAAIAAAFPAGYDKDRAEGLKIPAGGNQTPKLAIMLDTVGVLAKASGLAGAAHVADELMTLRAQRLHWVGEQGGKSQSGDGKADGGATSPARKLFCWSKLKNMGLEDAEKAEEVRWIASGELGASRSDSVRKKVRQPAQGGEVEESGNAAAGSPVRNKREGLGKSCPPRAGRGIGRTTPRSSRVWPVRP